MSRARLRAVRDEDSDGVIALIASCYAEYPPNVLDVDAEEPELRAPASRFERFWVVEAADGRIVGSVAAQSAAPSVMELKKYYVAADHRGQGWGRRLAEQVEAHARACGCSTLELWSDTRFDLGHRVYEALGYRRTGRSRELHDLSRTTEWHFQKPLP
jgi:GNAT superfamily N-acetyltransferase